MNAAEYRRLVDDALVARLKRDDWRAYEEFIVRGQRLLFDRARRAGVRRADCEDAVVEVLEHVAELLIAGRIAPPRSLAAYLVTAFHHRLGADARARAARRVREGAAAEDAAAGECAFPATTSAYALRASRGAEWEVPPLAPALARLAAAMDAGLRAEERLLLVWLGHYVSQAQIAEWLGVSYAAATQRVWRLRDRLRRAAVRYADGLDAAERRELEHFFRRLAPAERAGAAPPAQTHEPGRARESAPAAGTEGRDHDRARRPPAA